MPAIPIYQQQTRPQGQMSAAQPRMMREGGEIGQALQGLGANLQRVVDIKTDIVAREQADQNRIWAGMAASDWHVKQQQQLEDAKQAAAAAVSTGQPVPDVTGQFLKQYDEKQDAVLQMAPNDDTKRALQAHMISARTALAGQAVTFQAQLTREWKLSTAEQSVMNAGKIVQADPGQFSSQMELLKGTMPVIDPASDAGRMAAARAHLVNAAAGTLLVQDPYALKDATNKAMGEGGHTGPTGVPFIDAATPDQVRHWNDQAAVQIKRLEAEKDRAADARMKAAADAFNVLTQFAIEGRMPDAQYEAEVTLKTAGTPWEKDAAALLQQAKTGASFGAQTLPRQQAELAALEGKPTNPEAAKLIAHARTVYEAQARAAKDDPWAYGARFQRLPEVPEVVIPNGGALPALIKQRLPLMDGLEVATGFAVSPLRPGEVQQATDALAAMPLSQRSEVLGQIGDALKAQPARLQALAEQIDKGNRPLALSLKLGADRTTSGRMASELVMLGAQALGDKTVKKDDQALAGWRAEISGLVRGTLGDPRAEQEVIDAAYYVRAAQELEGVAPSGYKLPAGADKAIAMVAGTPVTRNGIKTLLPRGMTEADFDKKAVANLQPLAGQTLYVRGAPVPGDSLIGHWSSFGLRLVGAGQYVPIANNLPVTIDKEGQRPLTITVR